MKKSKVWFVTGGSKGLGLALTKLLLAQGHKVAVTSREIEHLKKNVGLSSPDFLPLQVDLRADAQVKKALDDSIEYFGAVDIVVNNAGYALAGAIEELTDEEFFKTLDINLLAAVRVVRHIMPHFRNRRTGHIINICSSAGYVGYANVASYSATKFALVGLSEALQQEVSPFNVHVTMVAPGEFRTTFMDKTSMHYAQNRIPAYGLDDLEKASNDYSGQQPGDPIKLAQVLCSLADMEQPPKRLLLGSDAYLQVTEQMHMQLEDFEKWKQVSSSTDFELE